ncbi:hypothetical protein ACLOJK_008504 [Asimina triloba]
MEVRGHVRACLKPKMEVLPWQGHDSCLQWGCCELLARHMLLSDRKSTALMLLAMAMSLSDVQQYRRRLHGVDHTPPTSPGSPPGSPTTVIFLTWPACCRRLPCRLLQPSSAARYSIRCRTARRRLLQPQLSSSAWIAQSKINGWRMARKKPWDCRCSRWDDDRRRSVIDDDRGLGGRAWPVNGEDAPVRALSLLSLLACDLIESGVALPSSSPAVNEPCRTAASPRGHRCRRC